MERTRHRKSKSASGIEGIRHTQRQKESARLSSDSRSYIDGRDRNEMFIPEFGHSPRAWGTGIPMKKLLAEEMSKEVGSKKQSPSVIAKLMGLEGMPSPRHVHRQQKRSADFSMNCQRNSQLYDDRANKTRWNDHQEFKDVYEDLEASHALNHRCSSRWNMSSLTKPELALIRQKFNDAKRLSTDEKFQDSKELDDTLEMLASNKDLLLQYLHRSDSLFVKHSHDSRSHSKSSVGDQIAVLKPSNSGKCERLAKARRPERDSAKKHRSTSPLKREDGLLLEPHSRHRTRTSHHCSRIQLEDNEEQILPTRIVVLKPNLANIQKDSGPGSFLSFSHGYQPGFNKAKEFSRVGSPDAVTWAQNDPLHDDGFSKPISKEAREIAREITTRMRNACHDTEAVVDTKSMRLKGYAGDESSCDGSESDSESEFGKFKFSGKTFSGSDLFRCPSRSGDSSVSREAKKRLSERWVVTHKYQDLEMVSRGSTLGEMLSLANREKVPHHLNAKTRLDRPTNQFASNNGPIGISSRDGWKDVIRRNVSRSRSLPPSTGGRRYRKNTYHDESAEDDPLMYADHIRCGRNMAMKENPSHKDDSSEDSKSRSKKPCPYEHKFANEIASSLEAKFEIQMEANTRELTKQKSMAEMVAEYDFRKNPVSDATAVPELRSPTLLSESSELLPTRSPSVIGADDKSPLHDPDDPPLQEQKQETPKQGSPSLQRPGAELDSPESSKEADHPSPVSVLEVPFTKTTSSSESFERVSAELHELRMQLHLLKIESGTHAQHSSLVPIEEESTTRLSPYVSEINHENRTISWETSYIIDLLIESALEESDFNIFRTKWPSPECPLDPTLFDHLEKKYNDTDNITRTTRSERKLLFDTINSAILEIFHNHVELYPWVQPKLLNVKKEGIREALEKLISQDFVNGEMLLETVDVEMQWSDAKEEIEAIGNDIEVLLLNDVVIDFLLCW